MHRSKGVERWIEDLLMEADAAATHAVESGTSDGGTAFYSFVASHVPGLAFVMPPNVDPRGRPSMIWQFAKWFREWYVMS